MFKFSDRTKKALENLEKAFAELSEVILSEENPYRAVEEADDYSLIVDGTFTSAFMDAKRIIGALCEAPKQTEEDIDEVAKRLDVSVEELANMSLRIASEKMIKEILN